MFRIRPDKKNQQTLKFLSELRARFDAMERYLLYNVADHVKDQIQSRLPAGSEYRTLRDSFEVVRGNSAEAVYAVRAVPPDEAAKDLDAKKTAVYVRAKRGPLTPPKDIRVLEQFSPWTLDTLPYAPDARFATLVHRKVSDREIVRLQKLREKDRPLWTRKLAEAGATGVRDARQLDLTNTRSVSDAAFLSLNLEFGLGTKSSPHWRPALATVRRGSAVKKIVGRTEFQNALSRPAFQGWRNWKRLGKTKISLSEMAKYQAFQDKLGLT